MFIELIPFYLIYILIFVVPALVIGKYRKLSNKKKTIILLVGLLLPFGVFPFAIMSAAFGSADGIKLFIILAFLPSLLAIILEGEISNIENNN
ncbi:MAG: hypothetical protein DRQ58_10010 [Gammaproteobacteria bacterium]|nr:MAG: hypothetical protein DRQ58_10010 [Gammaproteobacteria bacterium]